MKRSLSKKIVKRALIGTGVLAAVALVAFASFAALELQAYEESLEKTYDVPVPTLAASTDPEIIARGNHVATALAGCANKDCHGADLGGGNTLDMGPIGKFTGPNITQGGLGAVYTDGELARLVKHGIKKDGRSVRFMPVQDFSWLPDDDVTALVSYLRSVPAVARPNGPTSLTALGKVLDRQDLVLIDIARRIDHTRITTSPAPSANADYGRFVARACSGCHGEHFGGGPIPGAPPSLPVPRNLTPDPTGLAGWTYQEFERALTQGVRKNGDALNPFMPYETFRGLDEAEKRALYAYLQSIPPRKQGER
ncbi:MAG TPA: c-type cytochrome [Polyangiaceae bacterium]|nr:c-type cytochrome [Polyangiaceae bacterium]